MATRSKRGYSVRRVEFGAEIRRLDRRLFPADDPVEDVGQCFVVLHKGKIAAFATAKKAGRIVYLTRCGVTKKHRGRGLQKLLIAAREEWGRARGAKLAATYVASTNYPSINSLISSGYRMCAPSAVDWSGADGFLTMRRRLQK